VATLDEVVRIYERGGREITEGPDAGDGASSPLRSDELPRFTLTDGERADLLAFLASLTDEAFARDPTHADPW
jgi:cytochrome c peroxidase